MSVGLLIDLITLILVALGGDYHEQADVFPDN